MLTILAPLLLLSLPSLPMGEAIFSPYSHLLPAQPTVKILGQETLARLSASGVLVLDPRTGQQVAARAALTPRPMGSLTKIMTAVIVLEHHRPQDIVTIPREAMVVEGTRTGLAVGERYTVLDLLAALLVASGNDAAVALALHHSDDLASFVAEMNARAQELGLRGTEFRNPEGLDDPDQISTPRDLGLLTIHALRHPIFRTLVSARNWEVRAQGGAALLLTNTNRLLHHSALVRGVKTGTTSQAGECFIALISFPRRDVLIVLLGSDDRYRDVRILLEILTPVLG